MKKRRLISFCLTICLLTACGAKAKPEVPELIEPAAAKQEICYAEQMELYDVQVQDAGVVVPASTVRTKRSGVIAKVYTNFGEHCTKGQLLVRLDDTADKAAIQSMEKEIAEYRAEADSVNTVLGYRIQMKQLEIDQKRAASAGRTAIERLTLEKQALELEDTYNRTVQEQALNELNEELAKLQAAATGYELYAPGDGTVVWLSCSAGTSVQLNERLIAIADDTKQYIETKYISEKQLKSYDTIYARIGGEQFEVVYQPYTEEESKALIYSGDGLATRFLPKDPKKALTTGDYAAILLVSNQLGTVLTVPSEAVSANEDGNYVMVEQEGEKLYRPVVTGQKSGGYTEIKEGLTEGEAVILPDTVQYSALEAAGLKLATAATGTLEETIVLSGARAQYPEMVNAGYQGPAGRVVEVYKSNYEPVKAGEVLLTVALSADPIELLEAEIAVQEAEETLEKEIAARKSAINSVGINDAYTGKKEMQELQKNILRAELADFTAIETEKINVLKNTYAALQAQNGTRAVTAPISGLLIYQSNYETGDTIAKGAVVAAVVADATPVLTVKDSTGKLRYNSTVTVVNTNDATESYTGRVICAADIVPSALWNGTAVIAVEEFGMQNWNAMYTVSGFSKNLEEVLLVDSAYLTEKNGSYSIPVYQQGTVTTRYITPGMEANNRVWVLKGLQPGDQLVAE